MTAGRVSGGSSPLLLGLLERLLVDGRERRRAGGRPRVDSSASVKPGSVSTPVSRPVPPSSAIGSSGCGVPNRRDVGELGAERVLRRGRERAQEPVAGDVDAAAQRVRAERRHAAAAARVAAQAAREIGGDPAQRAGEQHARALVGEPAAARDQRQVGGDVVAHALPVEEGEQRRRVLREAVGQPVLHQLRVGDRAAARERVGHAVAVVVEPVLAEPGDGRQHDEDRLRHRRPARRTGRSCGSGRSRRRTRRGPTSPSGTFSRSTPPASRSPVRRGSRSPMRRMLHLNGRPRESTANSPLRRPRAPGRRAAARSACARSRRACRGPARCRRPAARSGRRSRPGRAPRRRSGRCPAAPARRRPGRPTRPCRTPGGSSKRATTSGPARSVRSTCICVGNVSETTSSSEADLARHGPGDPAVADVARSGSAAGVSSGDPRVQGRGAAAVAQRDAHVVEAVGRRRRRPRPRRPTRWSRGRPSRTGRSVAMRRTSSPSASTIVAVTSSSRAIFRRIRAVSMRPSPLGENCWVSPVMRATCGALLSRWATKKAANDATTSRTNAARAKRLNGDPGRTGLLAWPGRRPARTMTSASGASACVSSSTGSTASIREQLGDAGGPARGSPPRSRRWRPAASGRACWSRWCRARSRPPAAGGRRSCRRGRSSWCR